MTLRKLVLLTLLTTVWAATAGAQTTSLAKRQATSQPAVDPTRETPGNPGNTTLERHSLIAVEIKPPKKLQVHDLITVIVRQQTKYESDGKLNSKKQASIDSKIDEFIAWIDGGIGASTFRRGKPNIDYSLDTEIKNKADKEREDKLTTRVTAEIIDVKPNGNLVLAARSSQTFENEIAIMILTGTCRAIDVTPDNTVLSTQLADLDVTVKNHGAVRDGSSRGWLGWTLDKTKPF